MELPQVENINTDAFLNQAITGRPSESVQMADLALQTPTTTVDLVPLSQALLDLSQVESRPVPSIGSFGVTNGSGKQLENMFDMSTNTDQRMQSTKYDIAQDDVYTEFQTKGWEDWSGFGKVAKYENYQKGGDNEDRLAQEQSNWQMWGRGLEKALVTASTMVANTVGMIGYGIPKAIEQKSFSALIDNDLTRFLDDLNTHYQHEDMIYKSNEYKNASVLGSLKYGTLYADSLLQGLGYLVGGLAVGGAVGAGLKGVGLGTTMIGGATRGALGNLTRSVAAGDMSALATKAIIKSFKGAIASDLRRTTLKSAANNLATLITSAAPEAQMESLQFLKEDENQFVDTFKASTGRPPSAEEMDQYRAEAYSAANGVFTANLALVGASNFLQFGDLMGAEKIFKKGILDNMVNRTFGLGIQRTAVQAGTEGLESATYGIAKRTLGQRAGYRVFTALESPVTEGLWEEGMQSVVSNTASDYMQAKFDPNSTDKNRSIIESFGKGLAHTYGSKEGWQEIMMGMMIGGIGTFRKGPGGIDFLGQRAASQNIAQTEANAETLNKTQAQFIDANTRYLESQKQYNALANQSNINLNNRLSSSNQQTALSDKARLEAAKGNLEQSKLNYTSSVFAKLMAEERAGLSESNKFDMDMMLDNIPESTLRDMYGFETEEDMDAFKARTKKTLENQREAFKVANDFAEQLNLGATNSMSAANLHEASALHFFHGMMAADTANEIARTIEDTVGIGGVASAMNYYSNLDKTNQERIQKIKENKDLLLDLELRRSELLASFSQQSEKLAREPENEAVVKALDATTAMMTSLDNEIARNNEEISSLTNILSNRANIPKLPFGNPASKFFAGIGLDLADADVSGAMDTLSELETYIEHLQDTTGKSESQIAEDKNKAQVLQSMTGMYQTQMKHMRNFAKVANMVSDPSYGNNLVKRAKNKKDTKFDAKSWVDNDETGFDVNNEGALNPKLTALKAQLKELVDQGRISEFDMHTWISNAEIVSMHGQKFGDSKISVDELSSVMTRNEDGSMVYDLESDLGQSIIDQIVADIVSNVALSPAQAQVYMMNKELITQMVAEQRAATQAGLSSLVTPNNNQKVFEAERLRRIADKKIDQITEEFEEKYPISKLITGEVALPNIPEDENIDELSMNDILNYRTELLRQETDKVEAEYQEALNPTENSTKQITTALDQLNSFIDEVVQVVKDLNQEINSDVVNEFSTDSIPTPKDFADVKKLLNKGVRTAREQSLLDDLLKKINDYGLVEGRVNNQAGDPIRMSDLLEQRAQLENELFSDRKDSSILTPEEMRMTFESTTENEESLPEFKSGQATGDAAVLNSYEFSSFTAHGDNSYQVSNLTPQGFTEEITNGQMNVVTVTDIQGNLKTIDFTDPEWDKQIAPGDNIMIEIEGSAGSIYPPISFSVDNSRRIIISKMSAQVVSDSSNLIFDSKNQIGSSAHYVLTRLEEGVETYIGSDFNIELDSDATQRLNSGDPIYFEYDEEFPWNKALKEEYDALHPDEDSDVNYIDRRVNDIIAEIEQNRADMSTKEATEANKALFAELRQYFPEVTQNNIRTFRSKSKKMVDEYNKSFDTKLADQAKRKFKDTMVLVAKDKNGNRVGIVKSLQNSRINGNGRTKMDHLRTAVFEQLQADGFTTGTRSKFTVPVQIVYMGIPNITVTNGEKNLYRFSEEVGDTLIDPKKISAVGYATESGMVYNDGKKRDTPYNYAKSIVGNTLYAGRKVPVAVFNHNGKEVIYPIGLVEKDTAPMSERFQEILDQEGNMSHGEFVTSVNNFLAENGIPKDIRVTSLNYSQKMEAAVNAVANSLNLPTIDELMDKENFREVLRSSAYIDINLNDKPFVGPKVRFNLNEVPVTQSDLLYESSPTIKAETLEEILKNEDEQICE